MSMSPKTEQPQLLLVQGMSRSGTTLLTTMLDAHPCIAMGYELLPTELPPLADFAQLLDRSWNESNQSPRKAGNLLKQWGYPEAGVFSKRASRALVDPAELAEIIRIAVSNGMTTCATLQDRFLLASKIAQHKSNTLDSEWYGFKSPLLEKKTGYSYPRGSHRILIIRDPRDVWASHLGAGFNASLKQVIKTWNLYAKEVTESHPNQSHILYEDLVRTPEPVLTSICDQIGAQYDPCMVKFEHSKASIFRDGLNHVNSAKLKAGINPSAVGRWRESLTKRESNSIAKHCGRMMDALGYRFQA
ncbi:MAG: sulfotransferase [Phycisphaerales bacterium]|nr:sulfotransferase [Phycisphaerales bacterium]